MIASKRQVRQYDRSVVRAAYELLCIQAFIRDVPHLASLRLSQVQTPDLAEWRDARLKGFTNEAGENVPAVSPSTVLRNMSWLRNAFSVARKEWNPAVAPG